MIFRKRYLLRIECLLLSRATFSSHIVSLQEGTQKSQLTSHCASNETDSSMEKSFLWLGLILDQMNV